MGKLSAWLLEVMFKIGSYFIYLVLTWMDTLSAHTRLRLISFNILTFLLWSSTSSSSWSSTTSSGTRSCGTTNVGDKFFYVHTFQSSGKQTCKGSMIIFTLLHTIKCSCDTSVITLMLAY